MYTYHNKPPFIIDLKERRGLYFDLAERLNALSCHYQFVTAYLPRKRLDHIIDMNKLDGVVLGANPLWFDDLEEIKFLWLPPYYADRDDFISLKSAPFEYRGPASLAGKTLVAVAGYYYVGINEMVKKGELLRIDTVGEQEVIKLVEKKRADMGLLSLSVYSYLKKHHALEGIFHISTVPHDSFERRAFTSRSNVAIHAEMQRLFQQIMSDGSWESMRKQYE